MLGYFEGVWSTLVVGELVRVRVEHRIARGVERVVYRQRVNDRIHALSDVLAVADCRRAATSASLRDPDDPIQAAALAASAEYVVSLNMRDFPADGAVAGVRFLTPIAFPAELAARFPTADLPIRAARAGRQAPWSSRPGSATGRAARQGSPPDRAPDATVTDCTAGPSEPSRVIAG